MSQLPGDPEWAIQVVEDGGEWGLLPGGRCYRTKGEAEEECDHLSAVQFEDDAL